MVVRYFVDRFSIGVKDCRTVDCVLVKLTTAICDIRDYARSAIDGEYTAPKFIREFLHDGEVMKILSGVSHARSYIVEKVYNDPRFSPLKNYLQYILSAMDSAVEMGIEPPTVFKAYAREPTWQIEYQEVHGSTRPKGDSIVFRDSGVAERREIDDSGWGKAINVLRKYSGDRREITLMLIAVIAVVIAIAIAILLP